MTNGLLELGEIMLSASERRLETVSRNVANSATPGFKKETSFTEVLSPQAPGAERVPQQQFTDFSQGGLRLTGNPLDLALSGPGLFKLRSESGVFFGRGGQFERAADGTVRNAQGMALQTSTGGDLVLSGASAEIMQDGTVLENGLPIARIGLFRADDPSNLHSMGGGLFAFAGGGAQEAASPIVRQGMLETSNVEMASEMMEMMEALRQAEAGARIVQVFDALSGQVVSTFGQGAK